MTRKNAIKQLKMLKEHLKNDMYADDVNALNTAIQALESIDKIRAEIEQIADDEQKYDEKWATGLGYAVKIIDKYKAEGSDKK